MRPTVILAALCAVVLASSADARPRDHYRHHIPAVGMASVLPTSTVSRSSGHLKYLTHNAFRSKMSKRPAPMPSGLHRVMATGAGRIVGGRPPGCPRRYCGCGASLHIFGRIIPRLNLAANWLRFPRAAPAPGMVAARRHHVFVLKRHIRGKIWLVHDSNSGRGKTRVHPRSIAGFVIVDPRADS